ncbi:MAG: hypothetical protein ABI630_03365 [Betaproteobacteria bacterium]
MTPSFKIVGTYARQQGERRTYSYAIHGDHTSWEGLVRHNEMVKGVLGGRIDPPREATDTNGTSAHVRHLVEQAIENLVFMRE